MKSLIIHRLIRKGMMNAAAHTKVARNASLNLLLVLLRDNACKLRVSKLASDVPVNTLCRTLWVHRLQFEKHCSKEIHDTYGRKDEQVSVLNVGSVLDHPSYFYPYSATPNSETHPRTLPATPKYTRFAF